jgi:hypothetical protein
MDTLGPLCLKVIFLFLKKFEMAADRYSIIKWNWLKGRKKYTGTIEDWGRKKEAPGYPSRAFWDIYLKKWRK